MPSYLSIPLAILAWAAAAFVSAALLLVACVQAKKGVRKVRSALDNRRRHRRAIVESCRLIRAGQKWERPDGSPLYVMEVDSRYGSVQVATGLSPRCTTYTVSADRFRCAVVHDRYELVRDGDGEEEV